MASPQTKAATSRRSPKCAAAFREPREAQGLTWYSLAKKASVRNPTTIREIEYGCDAKLSHVQAIAAALGLKLKLVQQG